jgi:exodeoxyribonuclease VII small subunit
VSSKTVKKSGSKSFEDTVAQLESIVEEMESDDLPLEKLLVRYEEGAKLVNICGNKLKVAELKVRQLEEEMEGELKTQPLKIDENK